MGDVDEETGRLLSDRYRLGDVLGRGGMGTVWRARDEVLGRTVAVKELRFPSGIDEDEKRRLITRTLREAKAIARIRNSGAVTIYDVVDEDDRPWIVMELIEGRSLAEVIRDDGPLTPRRAAEVGLAVLDVLRAAHREGILHRDVKPSNVLIAEESGRAVLTDFGIAKVEGDPSVTSTGMLVGAPSYISPERARGHLPGPPADLWSLGGLLYAAVEGQPPYDKGSAIATLTAVMTEPMDRPVRAGALTEVLYRLLEKDPEKRLDEPGARAMLTAVLRDPEPAAADSGSELTAVLPADSVPGPPPTDAPWPDRSRSGPAAGSRRPEPGGGDRSTPVTSGSAGGSTAGVSRRTAVIAITVFVVLAVLGSVLAFALSGGDEDAAGKEPSQSAGPASGEKDEDQGATGGDEKPEEKPDEDATGPGDGGEKPGQPKIPAGYQMLDDDRFHFRVALPEGWLRTDTNFSDTGGIYTAPGGGYPKVQVDFTAEPGTDSLAAWQELEPSVRQLSTDYRLISMVNTTWRDYPTVADWRFERTEGDSAVRVSIQNRGVVVDDQHGYAIMVTCQAGEWDGEQCQTLLKTVYRTFQPTG